MTPEAKAKELIDKFYEHTSGWTKQSAWERAKQCALICVEEILNEFPIGFDNSFERKRKKYWQKVKEILEQ